MASITITPSVLKSCSKHQYKVGPPCSVGTKQASNHIVTLNVEDEKGPIMNGQQQMPPVAVNKSKEAECDIKHVKEGEEASEPKFFDLRWKEGTWDLNMFVRNGKMDWDGVIVAEARRRKFLEVYPEVSTNQAPVKIRTSIIPWWAWIAHSHLPEAKLLSGRAAMVGFFMSYVVDGLTGLDVVGQTGNFVCKAGIFVTILGVLLFRRSDDIEKLKKLADEATFYDKQCRASWQNDASN